MVAGTTTTAMARRGRDDEEFAVDAGRHGPCSMERMRHILGGALVVVAVGLGACSASSSSKPLPTQTECGNQVCAPGVYCISSTSNAAGSPAGSGPHRTPECRSLAPVPGNTPDASSDGGDAGDVDAGDASVSPAQCAPYETMCRTGNGQPGCLEVLPSTPGGTSRTCVGELPPSSADCQLAGEGEWTYACTYP